MLTGSGDYVYEVIDDWPRLPEHLILNDVADVGVDGDGHVYLFNRGDQPIVVVDRDGSLVGAWGDKATFPNAHGLTMGLDESLWLTDTADHTVKKCSLEGDVLLTLGTPGQPARPLSGKPFNRCTHVAIHPDTEEVFVSDGYGNAAIHRFTPDGRHQRSWGTHGNDPGQFNLPHNIAIDRDGYVYVADRHNSRIQVFTANGRLEHIWYGMALPCGMHIDTTASEQICYLTELSSTTWASSGPYAAIALSEIWNRPGMGPRVSVYSLDGRCLARLCDNGEGTELGQLVVPHGVTVDARGDIYVGMISWLTMGSLMDPPRQLRNVQKLKRVTTEASDAAEEPAFRS